jgi:hypothetical protein
MLELKPPTGENSVLNAFDVIRKNKDMKAEEMVTHYNLHFDAPPVPPSDVRPVFERFSLVDPAIRTVIQSSTTTFR